MVVVMDEEDELEIEQVLMLNDEELQKKEKECN